METATQTKTDAVPRLPDRFDWWKIPKESRGEYGMDYTVHAYDIRVEPLLREIRHDGAVVGTVTRNRYEAEVLNTALMFILDIDVQDDHGRCTSAALYRAILEEYARGRPVPVNEIIQRRLRALCDPRSDELQKVIEQATCGTLEDVCAANYTASLAGLGLRLYATRNGFRAICTTHVWDLGDPADSAVLWEFMKAAYTDDAYRTISFNQGLFRARLTRKPWRENEWQVCEFVETIGGTEVLPEFRGMLDEHDAVTNALKTSDMYE